MNIDEIPRRALTVREVAELFQISKQTVYNWCDTGLLESRKIGRKTLRIVRESVVQLWESGDRFKERGE